MLVVLVPAMILVQGVVITVWMGVLVVVELDVQEDVKEFARQIVNMIVILNVKVNVVNVLILV